MAEDVAFLRDQVRRLNAALAKYQEKYPTFHCSELTSSVNSKLPPWQTDKSLVNPLLVEYDLTFQGLHDQVAEYQKVRGDVDRLLAENNRLNNELKNTVESQLGHVEVTTEVNAGIQDEQLLQNLQNQVQIAIQEKENAVEMWKSAMTEIERVQAQLQEEKDSHSWRVVEKQATQVKEQYYTTVTALNSEINALQAELRETRNELTKSRMTVTDLEKSVEDLQQQLLWKDHEVTDAAMKEGIVDSKVMQMKKVADDLTQKCSKLSQELSQTKADRSSFEAKATELQKRNAELEQREIDSIAQVRESIQIVENAILDKDQAEVLVAQKEEENVELQTTIAKLINEAGLQSRKQVDLVRKQCNDSIQKLMEEVHALEMTIAEKDSLLERMVREKRMAEAELDQIHKEDLANGCKQRESYEDINRRAIVAERARDEALLRIETLEQNLKLEKMNHSQSLSQMESQISQLQQRLNQLCEENENVNQDRLKYLHDIDDLKNKLLSAQQEKEAAVRKYNKEVSLIEQDQQLQVRELQTKVESTEDVNRQTQSEMRKLLTAQQRMAARWKEECNTITQKLEGKLNEYKAELSRAKKRNDELTSIIKESQLKTSEAERTIVDYTHKIRRLEDRVRDSEFRATKTNKQLARQINREKQIILDQSNLQKELERSRLTSSTHSTPDPLAMSDLQGIYNNNGQL